MNFSDILPESFFNGLPEVDAVLILIIGAVGAFTAALLLSMWVLRRTGVPVYSAAPFTVRMAVELLALKDGERFCDLGCGLGRPLRCARRAAKVEATGYELNPFAVLFLWAMHVTDFHIRTRWKDFRKADLSSQDAIYLYLIPHVLPSLAHQLETQLKPGTRVVSVDFPMPGWKSMATREHGQKVWLYVMGNHLPKAGEVADDVASQQSQEAFQKMMVQSELQSAGVPIEDANANEAVPSGGTGEEKASASEKEAVENAPQKNQATSEEAVAECPASDLEKLA